MNPILNKHWAMEESALQTLAQSKFQPTTQATPQAATAASGGTEKPYQTANGVAVIGVTGVLQKYPDIFMELFGGTSTVEAKESFVSALDDESVTAILLYVDSPGGSVAGTADFAEVIANSTKPVWAYISDLGASAAYWIASQADKIYANQTASVGSIGVYTVLADTSKLYEKEGYKIHLVKAGELKGVGVGGVAISDADLADTQREIDEIYQVFVAKVASGRSMTEAKALPLATGQCWIASKAKEFGLIDGIASAEEVIALMSIEASDNIVGGTNNDSALAVDVKTQVEAGIVTFEYVAQPTSAIAEALAPVAIEPVIEPAVIEALPETVAVEVAKFEAVVASAADADERIKTAALEAYEQGEKHATQRLEALLEVCAAKPSFVIEQFLKGNDKGKAQAEYIALLEKEYSTNKVSAGAEPVSVAVADLRSAGSTSAASSKEEFVAEWEASDTLQKQYRTSGNYAAYKLMEAKKK